METATKEQQTISKVFYHETASGAKEASDFWPNQKQRRVGSLCFFGSWSVSGQLWALSELCPRTSIEIRPNLWYYGSRNQCVALLPPS
jgi:hypothetical protein